MFHVQRTSTRNLEIEDPVRNCSPSLRSALPFSFSQTCAGQAADEFCLETPTYFQVPTGDLGRMRATPHTGQRPGLQGSSLKVHSAQYFVVIRVIEHQQICFFIFSAHRLPRHEFLQYCLKIFLVTIGRCQNTTECILPTPPDTGMVQLAGRQ